MKPNLEQTLVLIKPDGVARGLVGEIVSRFERIGLKITAMKMILPQHADVDRHYELTEEWMQAVYDKAKKKYEDLGQEFPYGDYKSYGESIKRGLVEFLKSGPIVALVLEGEQAVALVRKLVGTEPMSAAPGTIRGIIRWTATRFPTQNSAAESHPRIRNRGRSQEGNRHLVLTRRAASLRACAGERALRSEFLPAG